MGKRTEIGGYQTYEGGLTLRYRGRNADEGQMTLEAYAASLNGWRELFQILGDLYRKSSPEATALLPREALQISIVAERRGSYAAVLKFVLGVAEKVVGSRADAALMWTYKRLMAWYKKVITSHISTKRRTTNVDAIAEALESMAQAENVMLLAEEVEPLQDGPYQDAAADDDGAVRAEHSARALVDKIDQALRHATDPLDRDCDWIDLIESDGEVVTSLGEGEREVLAAVLTLPPPEGIWRQQMVRFERINRKTGRALIYHESADKHAIAVSYARIVDPGVRAARNVYTEAFNADTPLKVWARQVRGERGHLRLMWEISEAPPEQLSLFGPPGTRA